MVARPPASPTSHRRAAPQPPPPPKRRHPVRAVRNSVRVLTRPTTVSVSSLGVVDDVTHPKVGHAVARIWVQCRGCHDSDEWQRPNAVFPCRGCQRHHWSVEHDHMVINRFCGHLVPGGSSRAGCNYHLALGVQHNGADLPY